MFSNVIWAIGLVLVGSLLLSGCTSLPPPVVELSPQETSRLIDKARERFVLDQELRCLRPQWWQVTGSLEMTQEDVHRRQRVAWVGEGDRYMRLQIFGPFRNVAVELTLAPEWLRLVDSGDKIAREVAADREGMAELTGLLIDPQWLYPAIMGCASGLVAGSTLKGGLLEVVTRDGERLWVDVDHGWIQKRVRVNAKGQELMVAYGWGEGGDQETDSSINLRQDSLRPSSVEGFSGLPPGPPMRRPERLEIRGDGGRSRLGLSFGAWRFFVQRPESAPDWDAPAPFPLSLSEKRRLGE